MISTTVSAPRHALGFIAQVDIKFPSPNPLQITPPTLTPLDLFPSITAHGPVARSNGESIQREQSFPGRLNRSNDGESYIPPRCTTARKLPEAGAHLELIQTPLIAR